MKLLILWASLSDYIVACFEELAKRNNVSIFLIYQGTKSEAPFKSFNLSFCGDTIEDKDQDNQRLQVAVRNFNPDVVFMASWNFPAYMKLAKDYRKKGVRVISSFDNQWYGKPKQYLGVLTSRWFLKPVIDNFIVPGDRQSYFAKRLGYSNPYQGFYCANTSRIKNNYNSKNQNFLFVGRIIPQKGIDILLEAFKQYYQIVDNPWELHIAGTGSMQQLCENIPGVKLKGFVQPDELPGLLADSGCFVLPSHYEPWGLVVHEAAAAGLPMIVTDACGSSTWFIRDGQNGYLINPEIKQLLKAMLKIHNKSEIERKEMSQISSQLAGLWTTDKWADYFYKEVMQG